MIAGTDRDKDGRTNPADPANVARANELKSANYELFILALSVLSIVNIALNLSIEDRAIDEVVYTVDLLVGFIFLGDFIMRLMTAKSKSRYVFRQYGWLDFLSGLPIPGVRILRVARMYRAYHLMRVYGLQNVIREFFAHRAGSALFFISLLAIIMLEFGSIAILSAEADRADANIVTAGDALWWSVVTMSTVGYGDRFPVSFEGRMVGIAVILIGVGLFGVVIGFLTNNFLPKQDAPDSSGDVDTDALLSELRKLQEEQRQSAAQLQSRLATIETRLQVTTPEPGGGPPATPQRGSGAGAPGGSASS